MSDKITCNGCNREISIDDKKCPFCGDENKASAWDKIVMFIFAVLGISGIITLLVWAGFISFLKNR